MMTDWMMGWGGMWLGPLFMIGLLLLLVLAIVALVRWLNGRRGAVGPRSPTPREILDTRFAKGEIEREEYEARRKALGV